MPAPSPELLANCLCVGAGGFVGAVARYLVGLAVPANGSGFPVATFVINIVGSFAIAFVTALFLRQVGIDARQFLFLTTGVCGGFTTFSTFSLESMRLIEKGDALLAGVYIVGSVAMCLIAAYLGQAAATRIAP